MNVFRVVCAAIVAMLLSCSHSQEPRAQKPTKDNTVAGDGTPALPDHLGQPLFSTDESEEEDASIPSDEQAQALADQVTEETIESIGGAGGDAGVPPPPGEPMADGGPIPVPGPERDGGLTEDGSGSDVQEGVVELTVPDGM